MADSAQQDDVSVRNAAKQITGLLDDDGHYNPDPGRPSRAHPDYDENSPDGRRQRPERQRKDKGEQNNADRERDRRGRFSKKPDQVDDLDDAEEADFEDLPEGDQEDEEDDRRASERDGESDTDDEAGTDDADTDNSIRTVTELAEALEIPPEELKASLTHTFRAAGEEVTVTLAELEKGYQRDADYRRSTAKLAEERRAVETQFVQRAQEYEQAAHATATVLNLSERMLSEELNSPVMAQLRQSDPSEWTARRTEIEQRINVLRNVRAQAAAEYARFAETTKRQTYDREMKALKEAVPDFDVSTHGKKASEAMASLGFSPAEIANLLDSRVIRGALELAELRTEVQSWRDKAKKAKETASRVKREVPKLQKPGKTRSANATGARVDRNKVQALSKRLNSTKNVRDAAKLIEATILR